MYVNIDDFIQMLNGMFKKKGEYFENYIWNSKPLVFILNQLHVFKWHNISSLGINYFTC